MRGTICRVAGVLAALAGITVGTLRSQEQTAPPGLAHPGYYWTWWVPEEDQAAPPLPEQGPPPPRDVPVVRAQGGDYAPPDPQLPLPLYSNRPADGGFFAAASFLMLRQNNMIRNQVIAYRGFVDVDGSITGTPGAFQGSKTDALNARQASGPMTYQPGFRIDMGWRFEGESAVSFKLSWMYVAEAKFDATASLAPKFLQGGPTLADTFLFSPVYGFPNDYAGPAQKATAGSPYALYGIWNGASFESIELVQRFQQWDATFRIPYYETECYRLSGLVGPRFLWIWERFKWFTKSIDSTGNGGPLDASYFTNIVSNRMYGAHVGMAQEWYLGHGFAATLDLGAAGLLDIVKERTTYEFAYKYQPPTSKRARTDYAFVPEFTGSAGILWYPIEGVEVGCNYDLWLLLNSIATEKPVAFDWGAPVGNYNHVARWIDSFQAHIAFVF